MMMMKQNITRRYQTEQEDSRPSTKPSTTINAAIPRRRALGDITNAHPEESKEGNVASKRPQTHFLPIPTESIRETQDETMQCATDRSYMQRMCDDVDSRDTDNPLLVTCYVNELYENFNEQEKQFQVNPNYMAKQDYVNDKMRTILVDWLVFY
jgi:hypothetical protein